METSIDVAIGVFALGVLLVAFLLWVITAIR